MEIIETTYHETLPIRADLYPDYDAQDPREDREMVSIMANVSRSAAYYGGTTLPDEVDCPTCEGGGDDDEGAFCKTCGGLGTVSPTLEQAARKLGAVGPVMVFQVNDYGSSGWSVSSGDLDAETLAEKVDEVSDSTAVLFATNETLHEAGVQIGEPDWIAKVLEGERAELAAYLEGDVYGVVVSSTDDEGEELEHLASCWGFVGYEYATGEAMREEMAEGVAVFTSEADEAAHWAARDVATLELDAAGRGVVTLPA